VRVLVLHGPNLDLLGEREPQTYGKLTLAQLDERIAAAARGLELEVRCEQHNDEGALVSAIGRAPRGYEAIVLNAAAYTHYSIAIRDAVAAAAARIPTVEVHLTNTAARESFRAHSVIAPVCAGSISGFGAESYVLALHALLLRRSTGAPSVYPFANAAESGSNVGGEDLDES
jgi:3-dehydroquinate dehydratase-2